MTTPTPQPPPSKPAKTLLFLHAHPDDETLSYAGAISQAVARGDRVVVVTATRGERGELIGEALQDIADDPDAIAAYRITEIAAAMRALGVDDHRFLGEDHGARYRDSGMRWGDDGHAVPERSDDPDTLSGAPLEQIADEIERLVVGIAPDVVVIPNGFGGYGHPDHIRVHDATLAAISRLQAPPAVFAAERPARIAAQRAERVRAGGRFAPVANDRMNTIPDRLVQVAIDVRPYQRQVLAALASYPSQVKIEVADGPGGIPRIFAGMSNDEADELGDYEYYRELTGNWRYFGGGAAPVAPDLTSGWRRIHDAPTVSAREQLVEGLWMLPVGAVLGACTTLMHQYLWYPTGTADLSVPVGLILGLLAVALGLAAARYLGRTRARALGVAVGLLAAVGVLSLQSPGGSILTPENGLGQAWIWGTLAIALIVLMLPVPSLTTGARRERMDDANVEGTPK